MNSDKNTTGAVERLRAYFEENASDDLRARAAEQGKTAEGAFAYAKSQARKLAVDGCACVDDATVYGWAMHYFEDEDASRWEPKKPAPKPSAAERKPVGKPDAETAEKPAEPAQDAPAGDADDGAGERGDAPGAPETPPPPPAEPKPVQTDLFAALGL